jgi:hypothetical protein
MCHLSEAIESCLSLPVLASVVQCRLDVGRQFEAEKLSAIDHRSIKEEQELVRNTEGIREVEALPVSEETYRAQKCLTW